MSQSTVQVIDYDIVIIGAGIGGLIMLQHALAAGLKAIILEPVS